LIVDPEDLKLARMQGARILSCRRNGLSYTEANTLPEDVLAKACAGMKAMLFGEQGCVVLTPGEVSLAKPISTKDFRRLAVQFPQALVVSFPQRIEGTA